MTIRTAHRAGLPLLPSLEVAAGVLFRDIGMTDVASHPPPSLEVFARLGFVELDELTPGLVEILGAETALGLDPAERIFLRRSLARQ